MNILIISISLSIDALGIGVSYKLKGVKITTIARTIIGIVSGFVMWLSLNIGTLMMEFFPSKVANIIGVSILVLIGLAFIRNALFGSEEATYDFDKSKNIEMWEACVLGFALSADSISAGIAVATMGIGTMFMPFSVGIMQFVFLSIGDLLIERCQRVREINKKLCGIVSGSLLIVIALLRVLK